MATIFVNTDRHPNTKVSSVSQRQTQKPTRPLKETRPTINTAYVVYQFRWATVDQIALVQGKTRRAAQNQVNKLCQYGILSRKPVQRVLTEKGGSAKMVYRIAKQGRDLLSRQVGISNFSSIPPANISQEFAAHTIGINDVRAITTRACTQNEWELAAWRTEYSFKAQKNKDRVSTVIQRKNGEKKQINVSILPDSYFSLSTLDDRQMNFMLELDRGTEKLETFQKKIAAYVTYLNSGQFEQRFTQKSFRVLTVVDTASSARLKALLTITELQPKIAKRFWFANLRDIQPETILTELIWTIAGCRQQASINPKKTA